MRIATLGDHLVGCRVVQTVHNPTGGPPLLVKGTVLTSSIIGKLRALGYRRIYVENELAPDIVVDDALSESTRQEATQVVRRVLQDLVQDRPIPTADVTRAVEAIMDEINSHDDIAFGLSTLRGLDDYTFVHSVNVCVLSLVLGRSLGYTRDQLRILGVGAILHDIGKVRLPRSLLTRPGPLTRAEFQEIKKHPQYGFDILRKHFEINLLSAHVAYQHHERLDGSGYPRGLRGDEIHPYAHICGVVDVFDALTADRPYRQAVPPHEAMAVIARDAGVAFDARLVRHLMHRVAAYPAGTLVRLNTGEVAVVTGQTQYAARPRVCVVSDPEQRLVEPSERNLAETGDLWIERVLPDYPARLRAQIRSRSRRRASSR